MFIIDITTDAIEDMRTFRKFDRQRIFAEIEGQLTYQPNVETRNRKLMKPNELAEWELRLDPFRIFYDIDETSLIVSIIAVGQKKGSRLYIRGVEYKL